MPGRETYKPLVFISHSAKDVTTREVLSKLYSALHQEYEVLLDRQRLRPNDQWRKELHTWLGLCHAAVVLISEHALRQSPWVKKEATILGYRREMDSEFVLIPVLVPPVTSEMLRVGDFSPLELDAIQMAAGETPEAVARQVLDRLEPLKDRLERRTPLQEIEDVVASILSELETEGKDPQPLFDAAAKLGKRLRWRSDKRYGAQLARELLSADLEQTADLLVTLAKYFGQKETALRLLSLLTPFWVDPDAISELPMINKQPCRKRAVSVNGVQYPFTGECYIQRACCGAYNWVSARITQPKGFEELEPEVQVGIIVEEIQKQVAPQIGFDEEDEPGAQDIERRLKAIEAKEPFFVLVPKDFDEGLIGLLRERLESFTFFILADAPILDALEEPHILPLQPQLSPGRDREVYDLVGETKGKIKRTK